MTRPKDPAGLLTLVVLTGWLLFNLLTLTKYPVPMNDEANYAVVSQQFACHGVFTSPIHGGLAYQSVNYSYSGRLWTIGQGVLMAIFGSSLFTARLFNLLAWAACAWIVYCVSRLIYSREVGLLAALVFALSASVFVRWRLARPDPWAATVVLLLFWLYVRFRERPTFVRSFALGMVALLTLDIYIAPVFFLPFYGLLLLRDGAARRDWKPVLGFGLGAFTGLTYVVLARMYPDAQAAYYQWFGLVPSVGASRIVEYGGTTLSTAVDWLGLYFVTSNRGLAGLESLLALAGAGVALVQRRTYEIELVAVYGAALVLFALLYSDKGFHHTALWLPFLAILIARSVWEAARWLGPRLSMGEAALAFVIATPWLLLNVTGGGWLIVKFWGNNWPASVAALHRLVPADAGIWAEESWWFAYPDTDFVANLSLYTLQYLDPDHVVSEQELVSYLRTNHVAYMLQEDASTFDELLLPPSFTVTEAIEKYCTPAGSVDGFFSEEYGRTTVRAYQCDFGTE